LAVKQLIFVAPGIEDHRKIRSKRVVASQYVNLTINPPTVLFIYTVPNTL